jgi:hypothetical protein
MHQFVCETTTPVIDVVAPTYYVGPLLIISNSYSLYQTPTHYIGLLLIISDLSDSLLIIIIRLLLIILSDSYLFPTYYIRLLLTYQSPIYVHGLLLRCQGLTFIGVLLIP